jgi:hypothetical protein
MYSLFTIVAGLILIFGTVQIVQWARTSEKLELGNFLSSVQNVIRKQTSRSYGSVDEKVIALPNDIESVCFVDKTKEISPLINCDLNFEINKYPDKNIFFGPFDKFSPISVSNFELNKDENPICLKSLQGTTRLSLTSKGNKTLVSTFRATEKDIDCVSVLYNSHPNNSIDVVFLSYGYSTFDNFREDVNDYVNLFVTTEPFKGNQDKINFYRVDKLDVLNCEVGSWVKCDEFEVKKLASYCPNDYIIVLVDRNKVQDFIKPVRSSAVSNMEKVNTADNMIVVLHEFGHIFGGLADEYVDERYYSNMGFDEDEYPNCDSPPDCNEWDGIEGTGCFEGCSLNEFSRPTADSLMRSLKTEQFGPLNENIMINKLNSYGER